MGFSVVHGIVKSMAVLSPSTAMPGQGFGVPCLPAAGLSRKCCLRRNLPRNRNSAATNTILFVDDEESAGRHGANPCSNGWATGVTVRSNGSLEALHHLSEPPL